MANNQREQDGGLPQQETAGQSAHATTGDEQPPQPGEIGDDEGGTRSGEGGGHSDDAGRNAGQQETGGTGGYGGTSDASGQ